MDEKGFWKNRVKKVLHQPPLHVARKVQDAYFRGWPDVYACQLGHASLIELKRIKKLPARESSLVPHGTTTEQKRVLLEIRNAGGAAWLLAGIEEKWYLFDPILLEMHCGADWHFTKGALLKGEVPAMLLTGTMFDLVPLREWLSRGLR